MPDGVGSNPGTYLHVLRAGNVRPYVVGGDKGTGRSARASVKMMSRKDMSEERRRKKSLVEDSKFRLLGFSPGMGSL